MHNTDRTVNEANYEYNHENYEYGGNQEYQGEYGSQEYQGEFGNQEMEGENEFLNELNGLSGESEYGGGMQGEYQGEAGYGSNEMNSEVLEMELATELLGVSNEAELEQFLGKMFKRVVGGAKNFINSSAGKALIGVAKAAGKKLLPIAGTALGNLVAPGVGGMIGGKLGSMASNLFELELEGLSNEDKEFELSRAYVRFATDAARRSVRHPLIRTQPRLAVKNAVVAAARTHAPGLLRRGRGSRRNYGRPVSAGYGTYNNYNDYSGVNDYQGSNGYSGYNNSNGDQQQSSGTWYRQGNQIILNL